MAKNEWWRQVSRDEVLRSAQFDLLRSESQSQTLLSDRVRTYMLFQVCNGNLHGSKFEMLRMDKNGWACLARLPEGSNLTQRCAHRLHSEINVQRTSIYHALPPAWFSGLIWWYGKAHPRWKSCGNYAWWFEMRVCIDVVPENCQAWVLMDTDRNW